MTGEIAAILGPAAAAWLGWCWVLVRRGDFASRARLEAAERRASEASCNAALVRDEARRALAEAVAIRHELDAMASRVQGVINRQGMR